MSRLDRRRFLNSMILVPVAGQLWADDIRTGSNNVEKPLIHTGSSIAEKSPTNRGPAANLVDGKVIRPQHEIKVMRDTDILVVGGGCAGVMAAISAARTGAKVTLVERYGCFGGLWTAGQVLIVLATHAGSRKQPGSKCVQGIGDELLERHKKFRFGIVNQEPEKCDPTTDPEATKYIMANMLREAGVDILLHSWVTNTVMDGDALRGVIFESKAGCHAIMAKVVIDTTGDGDVYAAAGAQHIRHIHKIGLVHRLGNVDRVTGKSRLGLITPNPSIKWVNMQGPPGDCLDVETLTKCELDGREAIWKKLKKLQEKPGHEKVFLLDTASQLGVRASRSLKGQYELTKADVGGSFDDVIGVGGCNFIKQPCQLPYGILLPEKVDHILAAGRCVSADNMMLNYTRLIGPALVTGHAAGAAAATAIATNTTPQTVAVPKVQELLVQQGAYLG